jgi:hypothetical protein
VDSYRLATKEPPPANLWQVWIKLRECRYSGEVMGLMERRQRNEAAQFGDHRGVDTNRGGIQRSAMHHPVSGRDQPMVLKAGFQPA